MLTGKQRAKLRAMAQEVEPIIFIGKDGLTENIVRQADEALEARELVKGSVQQNSAVEARGACDALCEALGADAVSVLGRKFVLYRESANKKRIQI